MIGRTLGHFRILEEIGAGGMGVVYRAFDERLRRDVALKFLPPGVLADAETRRMFQREAQALSRLNHPGIATVHDFQSIDGQDFIVMEYIPGESLDRRVAAGPVPESEVVAIGLQLAEGLAEAHSQGVIHRDLKPGNLRMMPSGRLKILDFGLAKWLGPDSTSVVTLTATPGASTGGIAGTPVFLAPELFEGAPASVRSDLYAAGLVMYELSTGRRPFPGLPVGALMEAIRHQSPPTPRSLNPAISTRLEAVIQRCIERQPENRYASADDLADALRVLADPRAPRRRIRLLPRRFARRFGMPLVGAGLLALAAVLAWRFGRPADPRASAIRSLAVLPLGNLSGEPGQEYFADGMTEALIAQLSSVHALRVTSLTSVMRYKKGGRSTPQIARELGVDGVIEGNILKARDRLRTTVHLVDARDDEQLWSGEYVGDTTDVLTLQGRVARAIVQEIRVRLSSAERARLRVPSRVDPVAHELYLRGRYQWNRRSDAGLRLAIDYFTRAIAQDSMYALAHAGLADAWAEAGLYGLYAPLEVRERARAEALRAVVLDPALPEGHTALGHILHNFDWDWDGAEREYQQAIALNPSDAVARHFHAHLLAQRGQLDAARRELHQAQELDPLSLATALAAGVFEYYDRHYDLALARLQRVAELDSNSALLHRARAAVFDRQGREGAAVREMARSFELRGQPEVAKVLDRAYRAGGFRGAVAVMIEGLLRKRASSAYEPAEHLAELYARLGRTEEAFQWLETAYREHDTELNRLRADPIFDSLRGDPRFADLLRRVGLRSAAVASTL